MSITAIALLELEQLSLPPGSPVRVEQLEDAVLVHLAEDFAQEPEQLSLAVRALVGDVLDEEHNDPRGIFFIPSVAAPQARSYEAVVDEVGEGGVWGPLPSVLELGEEGEGFGALLGNLLGHMPESLLSAANAAAQGDPNALANMGKQMQALMGSSPELQGLAAQLSGMLGASGAAGSAQPPPDPHALLTQLGGGEAPDLSQLDALLGGSPALKELADSMQADLARDPEKLRELTARFRHEDDDSAGPKKP